MVSQSPTPRPELPSARSSIKFGLRGWFPVSDVPGGRDHWSQVYSGLFAGGGVREGSVVGSSDRHGAYVRERPVSPKDVLATVYHLLGVDPHTTLHDRTGRPLPLVAEGQVIEELLA